jgi:glycerol-3-phosphate acyltransferase PlsY
MPLSSPASMDYSLAIAGTAGLCAAAYLLGSIPFGLLLTKIFGYGDIRNIGSGNIGATNVLRTGNKGLAVATLLLDGAKGALAVFIGRWLAIDPALPALLGFFAVLGHCFPVWLKFKGGKGVATALGFILALSWQLGLAMLGIWLIIAFAFRYSSLAALAAFITAPVLSWFMEMPILILPSLGLAVLIVWKHRENIDRLFKGSESKIGKKA